MLPIPVPWSLVWYLLALAALDTWLLARWWRARSGEGGIVAAWEAFLLRRAGWRALVGGIGWGVLVALVGVAWLRLLLRTGDYLPIPVVPTLWDWLALVVAVPVLEETLFRGEVYRRLRREWHISWAMLLSAGLYAVVHPREPWLAYVLLTGIGYALAYQGSGAVLAALLAHALGAGILLAARIHPGEMAVVPASLLWMVGGAAVVAILAATLRRPRLLPRHEE